MPIRPSAVELNGVRYRIADELDVPYVERSEPGIVRLPGVLGASFGGQKESRPDVLTWRLDDWSGGEGVQVFDSTEPSHGRSYYYSGSPVNVSVPGKVSLGFILTQSVDLGNLAGGGPYLAVAGGNPFAFYDTSAKEMTSLDTWTARTTGSSGTDYIRAPVLGFGGAVWASYSTNRTRKITSSTNTQWTADATNVIAIVNSRLYYTTVSTNSILGHVGLSGTTPLARNTDGTLDGYSSGNTSSIAATGAKLWFAASETGEDPVLYVFGNQDGSQQTLVERGKLPRSFRMDTAVPINENCAMLNDVVFLGGWFEGDHNQAAVLFFRDDTSGVLGIIRDWDSSVNRRVNCIAATGRNELMIGVSNRTALQFPEIYRYDMATGGISWFARLFPALGTTTEVTEPKSIIRSGGHYYIGFGPATYGAGANSNGQIWRTGVYEGGAVINHPIWHFDFPGDEKVLFEVEVQTDPLASGTSVSVAFTLDGSTSVTVDRNSVAMTHSGTGATRTLFQLNNKFRYLQPKITLTTSNTANTPVLLSVTIRATPVGFTRFYEFTATLTDDNANTRKVGEQLTGNAKLANLRTLLENKVAFTAKFFYPGTTMKRYPGPSASSKTCIVNKLEVKETSQGEGLATVTLREI